MKWFTLCFIVSGGLGGFNTFLNLTGYYLTEETRVSYIDYTTLANSYGFDNMTSNSSAATWVGDITAKKTFYYFFDLGYSSFIVCCIFILKVFADVVKNQVRRKAPLAKHYAIEVSGLPTSGDY